MIMISGIKWIRSRQRALARAVLTLFALAWVQAAIAPCSMAHATGHASTATLQVHDGAHAGHGPGHDGHLAHDAQEPQVSHCPYCPPAPDGHDGGCDHEAECSFPHDPQIDARPLTAFFAPPPSQFLDFGLRLDAPALRISPADVPPDVTRRPLAIRYCRFIE